HVFCQVDECHSAWKIRLELDEIVKFFAQAGITEVHFLLFDPESSVFLILIEELIEKADGFAGVFLGFDGVAFFIPESQLGPFMREECHGPGAGYLSKATKTQSMAARLVSNAISLDNRQCT
nr:hypothetical protein [Tanacetum cinerariifolium]